MERPKTTNVLFICRGNMFRSVIAEAVARKYLKDNNIGLINVYSAGVGSMARLGMTPDYDVSAFIRDRTGYDYSSHRSRFLTEDLVQSADLILVMGYRHRNYIAKRYPYASDKVFLLKEFCGGEGSIGNYKKYSDDVAEYSAKAMEKISLGL